MEPVEYHGNPLRRLADVDYRGIAPALGAAGEDARRRAAEQACDAVEAWAAAHPRLCGAVLFPLEPSRDVVALVVHEAWANGVPVHPLLVPYGEPVQGPRPLACLLEPHPEGTWHWNEGTWWR